MKRVIRQLVHANQDVFMDGREMVVKLVSLCIFLQVCQRFLEAYLEANHAVC